MPVLPRDESGLNHRLRRQLAAELTELIRRHGLTQKQAAARLGTSQARISQISCSRVHDVSIDALVSMIAALGGEVGLTTVSPSH